jgi:hypothetical protein
MKPGAFDEAGINLLLEMAMDIDHALNSFQREARREQAESARCAPVSNACAR